MLPIWAQLAGPSLAWDVRLTHGHITWVHTFTSVGPGLAEDTVLLGRTGAVDLMGGWSAAGVFKNSGTDGDTAVNWGEQKGNKSEKPRTATKKHQSHWNSTFCWPF